MSTLTTFKGDTLKASKDIVPQTIGWWGGTNLQTTGTAKFGDFVGLYPC